MTGRQRLHWLGLWGPDSVEPGPVHIIWPGLRFSNEDQAWERIANVSELAPLSFCTYTVDSRFPSSSDTLMDHKKNLTVDLFEVREKFTE